MTSPTRHDSEPCQPCVYILRTKKATGVTGLYVNFTDNLKGRIADHRTLEGTPRRKTGRAAVLKLTRFQSFELVWSITVPTLRDAERIRDTITRWPTADKNDLVKGIRNNATEYWVDLHASQNRSVKKR